MIVGSLQIIFCSKYYFLSFFLNFLHYYVSEYDWLSDLQFSIRLGYIQMSCILQTHALLCITTHYNFLKIVAYVLCTK